MLQKQVVTIPLANGLDTKTDEFQVNPGKALLLQNARFKKTGKLSKRNGHNNLTIQSNDGVFASANKRHVVSDKEYLSVVTDKGVYGYSEGDNTWFKQSNFGLASKITTSFVAQNPFSQHGEDMDITSDGTHAAYIAKQTPPTGTSFNLNVIIVLEDLATGLKKSANIMTALSGNPMNRIVCVKAAGVLNVHAFYYDGSNIIRTIYDKDLNVISPATNIIAAADTGQFDLCKDSDTIYFAYINGTALNLKTYNFIGTQTATLSTTVTNALRTVGGYGRGLCIDFFSNTLHVAWVNNSNGSGLKGFSKALSPTISEANVSGKTSKISICESNGGIALVSDGSTLNTQDCSLFYAQGSFSSSYSFPVPTEVFRVAIASKVVNILGKDIILARCNETENKSYYVYNLTDQYICQVFSPNLADLSTIPNLTIVTMVSKSIVLNNVLHAVIPRVAKTETSNPFGTVFTINTLGMSLTRHDFNKTYEDGCRSKIGDRIYLTAGAIIEMDKTNPHENGFVMSPKIDSVVATAGATNPNISNKKFSYRAIYEYRDSSGQITRSAPTDLSTITTASTGIASVSVTVKETVCSLKSKISLTAFNNIVNIVLYRTKDQLTANGLTFYRCAEVLSVGNDGGTVTFTDNLDDASLGSREELYTTGEVLPNNPAPTARFSTSGGNRLFLGGLEEKDEVAYSKKQLYGESVGFSDLFRMRVSSGSNADKTPLSALGYLDEKFIIFRQNSIYYVSGDGPNELGANDTFSVPQLVSSDTGCSEPRSVINVPGGLMFKSAKGIYLLSGGLAVSYVGAEVEEYNSETIISTVRSDDLNEVRFTTSSGISLVFNYLYSQWSVFTNQTIVDSDVWKSSIVKATPSEVSLEDDSTFLDGVTPIGLKLKTAWIKLNGLQDFGRIWTASILGKYKSAHTLRVTVFYDYATDYSEVFDISPQPSDSQYAYQIHLKKQKCASVQFEIQDLSQTGESMELTAITLEVGLRTGSRKLAASRKY